MKRNEEIDGTEFACLTINADLEAENEKLKKQLAEKEKEIELLKHIERYDIGEMFLENAKLIIEKRQFAIQQLEKLRHYIWTNQQDDGWLDESVDIYSLNETIDQIIKELEGETK